MAVTSDEFRTALSRFASGVTVVTTKDAAGKFHGITVSAFCSVSLEPPLILVCIEKITGSHNALKESKTFNVNILSETQSDVSEHFALPVQNKFDHIEYEMGTNGLPILKDIAVSMECRLQAAYDGGDHTIFVGEVENVTINDVHPVVYLHGEYRRITESL